MAQRDRGAQTQGTRTRRRPLAGAHRGTMQDFRTIHEIAKAARRNLDDNLWDYVVGGADAEATLRRNRLALDSLQFKPRVLNDVSAVAMTTAFLGKRLRLPVLLAPIGSTQDLTPGGGATACAAAQSFGTAMMLSSASQPDFEAVAAAVPTATGEFPSCRIYQLYLVGDQAWMDDIIERAIAAGYDAFCLTVDTAVYSRRERDIAKRFVPSSGRLADGSAFGSQGPGGFPRPSPHDVGHRGAHQGKVRHAAHVKGHPAGRRRGAGR